MDPEIVLGKPCVKGTRIPVYVLLQKMAAGDSEAEILQAYPQLSALRKIEAIKVGVRLLERFSMISPTEFREKLRIQAGAA